MSIYVDINKQLGNFNLDIQLNVAKENIGLLGSSGCGKSITLKCIAGIITPDKGEIILNDKILFSSKKKINLIPQERNVGLMFQSYALFPNMTVAQNITIGIANKSSTEKLNIIKPFLELFELDGFENRYPRQLSGGQQQRVALARIMAKNPDILMLDEPFSALDSHLRFSIEDEFAVALNNYNGTVIYVSHSIDEVYRFCDSTAIMDNGKILEKANTDTIFKNPTTIEAAKLTGCKNFSSAKKINENLITASDWGINFNIESTIEDDIKYIGIRENSIIIENFIKDMNSFQVSIAEVKESPFNTTLILVPSEYKNFQKNKKIICEYDKENAQKIISMEAQNKIYAIIEEKDILLLR